MDPVGIDIGHMGFVGEVTVSCEDGFLSIRNVPEGQLGDMVAYRTYIRFLEAYRHGVDDVFRAMIPTKCDDVAGFMEIIPESANITAKRITSIIRMAESTDDLRFLAELSFYMMGRVRESVESLRGRIPDDMSESLLHSISVVESYLRSLRMMV